MRNRRKYFRKIIGISTLMIIISLTLGSLWYFHASRPDHKRMLSDDTEDRAIQIDSETVITATGITEIGVEPVIFPVDFLQDASLCVEEVYLADGDTVAAGEPCIRFTDESIQRAGAKLEKAVQDAELAYRSKVISNGEEKIQAKYTYDAAVLEAEYAPQVYQDTLTRLEMQLVKAQKACEDAQEAYNTYYTAVAYNTFYEDYQIEKLKKAYEDAYDLFASRRAYWEVTQEELSALSGDQAARGGQNDRQWTVRTVALLKDEMTTAHEEYEQARQAYQKEIEGAELKLQKLLNQQERAQQELVDAQLECERESLHAKTTCELSAAKGQTAESDYKACLMGIDGELERLKDARDRAVENKAFFDELVGDGYLYTERPGTIFRVYAEKGQTLTGEEQIFAYSDPNERLVSVIVPESDAGSLHVGERASVAIADCGSFDGLIEAVVPIAAPDERTAIHSIITVSITGDSNMIGPAWTAVVTFGEAVADEAVQCSVGGGGVTVCESVSPMFDTDNRTEIDRGNADCLKIAKIYVEEGQYVREGEPVCQFAQDSVERVRKSLTYAQSDAQRALMKAQTSYHIGVLEAGLSHNEAMVGRTLAQAAYDNTIAKLNTGMRAKILETEQLLTDIYRMQTELTDDAHQRRNADVARAYEQAKKQVENARECFVTRQVESAQVLQEAEAAYENFFDHLETSNREIAAMIEEVNVLQKEILQEQQIMDKELLTAEQTRISALTEGELAGARYTERLKEYQNAVRTAQSDLEQAMQELVDFERFVGDGTLHAAGDGLVTKVGCREGDLLDDVRKLVFYVPESYVPESDGEGTQ